MKWLLKKYWLYVYNMEVQRGETLQLLYTKEQTRISIAKREAIQRLAELNQEPVQA